jgi:hypothetical protein
MTFVDTYVARMQFLWTAEGAAMVLLVLGIRRVLLTEVWKYPVRLHWKVMWLPFIFWPCAI